MAGRRTRLGEATLARLKARGHAIRRARERFCLTLGFGDVKEIEREILLEKWCRLGRAGDRGLYLVRRSDRELPVVYDHALGAAVTVLGDPSWFSRSLK